MLEIKFGRKNEPSYFLDVSSDLITVRTRMPGALLSPALVPVLDGCELVLEFPKAGTQVFRLPGSRYSPSDCKKDLRKRPEVRFAGSALVDMKSRQPVVYTENIFIKFLDALSTEACLEVIDGASLIIKSKVDYATNAYFVTPGEGIGTQVFPVALQLLARPDVEFCHPEILRQMHFKAIHPNQWHLKKTVVSYQYPIDASANVEAAHALTMGYGVVIAVIDDAIDIDHPELSGPKKVVAPQRFPSPNEEFRDDPRPADSYEDHGTPVAGVACANGMFGASGVAPEATLLPISLDNADALGSQAEADAFCWAANHGADIINCSWGAPDGLWYQPEDPQHHTVVPLPASTRLAIDYATTKGRGGKGCVVFFAAGNGNESVENDGYASYPRVIAVAACNDKSQRSIYSDYGKSVWCAFPSNDYASPRDEHDGSITKGIWTTAVTGSLKERSDFPWGNFDDSFGGTSSATPGVSGVAALILSANPGLLREEVRDILARTCDKIGEVPYDANGHNPYYGHGRVNALRAVEMALDYKKS